MENLTDFNIHGKDGSVTHRTVSVKKVCLARHCGRDTEKTRKGLDEWRDQGYSVHGNPSITRKSRYLLTNENVIEVQGAQTSGEVEVVAIFDGGDILISTGSDHVDRAPETMWSDFGGKVYDSAKLKQLEPVVIARDAWWYQDVKDHWDSLNLKAYVTIDGKKTLYQDFTTSSLLPLEHHMKNEPWLKEDGTVLYCGTWDTLQVQPNVYQFQPHIKDLYFPPDFHFEVYDPVLNRRITHSYTIQSIEPVGSISL